MLQRIQSIWLFIAASINTSVIFCDLYRWHDTLNGVDMKHEIRVSNDFPMLLVTLICAILPLITIFMFKNRKRQIGLSVFSIVSVGGFIAIMLAEVTSKTKVNPTVASGTYWVGAVLPIIALVFLILAIVGIRKDDKLVKSMDRLR